VPSRVFLNASRWAAGLSPNRRQVLGNLEERGRHQIRDWIDTDFANPLTFTHFGQCASPGSRDSLKNRIRISRGIALPSAVLSNGHGEDQIAVAPDPGPYGGAGPTSRCWFCGWWEEDRLQGR